ncbi:MAG TPA: glycosyltransferase family A protein [Candidatus Omnitrophota bacterium]|nr:glycosyltransferase family A protein [Candidatus Omnitrophota bacterium]
MANDQNVLFSIIIPTHDRVGVLAATLDALACQSFPMQTCEVIVVNDGSVDRTEEFLQANRLRYPFRLTVYSQLNKGPAAARNVGIRNALGKIILFLGDDMIADTKLVRHHYEMHQQHPAPHIGVLGFVTWASSLTITPFMRWLENGGPQFHYGHLSDKSRVPWKYFYTANVSVKKEFMTLCNELFDESFPYAAFEDSELGYRLAQHGFVLIYQKDAVVFHDHATSLIDACHRMEKLGFSAQIIGEKVPEYAYFCNEVKGRSLIRRFVRFFRYKLNFLRAAYYEKRCIQASVFEPVLRYWWQKGCQRYRKDGIAQ